MDDLISRQAAIDALKSAKGKDPFGRYDLQNIGLDWGVSAIESLPSIQPKRGRWELDDDPHDGDCRCSRCGTAIEAMNERHHGLLNTLTGGKWWTFYKYCPVCGARMEKGEEQT